MLVSIRILAASTLLKKYTGIYLGTPSYAMAWKFSEYSWSLSDMAVNANMGESTLSG